MGEYTIKYYKLKVLKSIFWN